MATTEAITIEVGVVFGSGGGRDLLCDIYTPQSGNGIGVLLLYGGGWSRGDRSRMRDQGMALSGAGFTCVAGEYRLNGESPWPAQIHDVKAAIRWMRANSERLGIDCGDPRPPGLPLTPEQRVYVLRRAAELGLSTVAVA